MLVTAYNDRGPGRDWPYYAPKKKGEKAKKQEVWDGTLSLWRITILNRILSGLL